MIPNRVLIDPPHAVFYNSGQDCCAGTRLLVQDSCYDEFMPKLIALAKACAIGDVSCALRLKFLGLCADGHPSRRSRGTTRPRSGP
jgi:hypothetical protein